MNEISAYYQTSGLIRVPFVTMHTTGDPVTPYWHESIYRIKIFRNSSYLYHTNIPVFRYGHCNFTTDEVMLAISIMIKKVTFMELLIPQRVFPDMNSRDKFFQKAKERGLNPKEVEELPEK